MVEWIFFPSGHLAVSGSTGWYSWHPMSKDQGGYSTLHNGQPIQQRTSHPTYLQFHDWEIPVFRDVEFQVCHRNTRLDKYWPAKKLGLLPSSCHIMPLNSRTSNPLQALFPLGLRPWCEGYRQTKRVWEVGSLSKRTSSSLPAPRSVRA